MLAPKCGGSGLSVAGRGVIAVGGEALPRGRMTESATVAVAPPVSAAQDADAAC
jgi:hypothetical protein